MNDGEQVSPDAPKQRVVEKSAFEDDDESEEEDLVQKAGSTSAKPFAGAEESKGDATGVTRTLSDTVDEQKVQAAVQQATTSAASAKASPRENDENLTPEEARRRTDELIQKMLHDDQVQESNYYNEEGEEYYQEHELPDEQQQIEIIRRMRHNEVASEANNTLQMLAALQQRQAELQSSPSPQSTPEKAQTGADQRQPPPYSEASQQERLALSTQPVAVAAQAKPEEVKQEPDAPPKKKGFFERIFGGNNDKSEQAGKPKPQTEANQSRPSQQSRGYDAQMAAAIAASLNQNREGDREAQTEAETEELMMMIARRESEQMEQERMAKERALEQEKVNQQRKRKVYDDIIFDSTAISQIHPRLHVVKVEHMQYIANQIDLDSVNYDGEYFMMRPEEEVEEEQQLVQKEGKQSKFDEMLGKVDKLLTDIGL